MRWNFKPYVKLSRPMNLLLVATVVLIAWTLFTPLPNFWRVFLVIIATTTITAGGNALNDMCDIEIDRINKPNRPLPSGMINEDSARIFMIAMFVVGNVAGLVLGFWSLFITLFVATPLLFWYAHRLRHIALVGNIVVAFLSALAFVFAAQAFGSIRLGYVPFVLTFILSVIREIVKDLEDVNGDEAQDSKTLPVMIGETPTRIITGIMILFFLPIVPIPYVAGLFGKWFFLTGLVGVVFPLVVLMIQLFQIKRVLDYHQIAVIMKIVMFIGLACVFVGRF